MVGDLLSLLGTVDRPTSGGCIVVRLLFRTAPPTELRRVRDRLAEEAVVVATAVDAADADGGTLDVLVEPGCDVATVGAALSAVPEVDAVAAVAFEASLREADAASEWPDGAAPQSAVDEAFDALQQQIDPVPYDALVDELERTQLGADDADLGPLLGGKRAGEEDAPSDVGVAGATAASGVGGTGRERPVEADGRGAVRDRSAATGGHPTARGGHPAEEVAARLDDVERRVAALEDRLDDRRDVPDADSLSERLRSLESTVEGLADRQARLRGALCDGSG